MSQRGQIKNCIVDGPLAFDNAVSMEAVKKKKVTSPVDVAGKADVLIMPNIDAGNMLLKSIRILGGCKTAGVMMGATVPVVVTSRADSAENKICAIACAVYEAL